MAQLFHSLNVFASRIYVMLATSMNVIVDADWLSESVSSITNLRLYRVEAMCACAGTCALMEGLLVPRAAPNAFWTCYGLRIEKR